MTPDAMERERLLIQEVEALVPAFVEACRNEEADFVIMSQDAFAPEYGSLELVLLAKAIKYAGIVGKELRIVPAKRPAAS